MKLLRFAFPLCLSLLMLLAGCDSGDPIDREGPSDVAGVYHFAELRFRPDASGLTTANVLAALDSANTQLRLSDNGNFTLLYEFKNGSPYTAIGKFEVTERTVRLNGSGTENYVRLLLDPTTTLQRSETERRVLSATIRKTVNLDAYDPDEYAGLTSVHGTLYIRLVRR